MVANDGELCWTALSSRSSRSSSDRLVPRADAMAAEDESDGFCLFGKLDGEEGRWLARRRGGWSLSLLVPVDVVVLSVGQGGAAAVPGP